MIDELDEPKECHNLKKKSSDKNETSIDIKLLVLIKRNLRPYIGQSLVVPDVEATFYEPKIPSTSIQILSKTEIFFLYHVLTFLPHLNGVFEHQKSQVFENGPQ